MQKYERDLRKQLQDLGLRIVAITNSGNHYRAEVEAPNGKKTTFFASDSNDPHAHKNNRKAFQAFAKQNAGHQTALAAALASVVPTTAPVAPHSFTLPPPPPAPTQSIAQAPAIEVTIPDAEPSPTPDTNSSKETVMPAKSTRASPRRLSGAEFYQLCEWLKAQDPKTLYVYLDIAKAASKSLGFDVSPTTIPEAMSATGLVLAEVPLVPRVRQDRVAIVAKGLLKVMKALGMPEDPELQAVADRRVADEK